MLQRVVYGLLAIAILVTLFLFDVLIAAQAEELAGPFGELLRRGSILPITFVAVLLLAAVELNQLLRLKGLQPYSAFAGVMITVLLLTPWLSAAGWLGHGAVEVEGIYWQVVGLIVAGIGVGLLGVIRRDPPGALRDGGATLLLIVYLGFFGSFGLQLRCGRDSPDQAGLWLLLLLLLVTKTSDIGGFFVGSMLGRHKLIPSISPGKSIEGTIGGMVASAAAAALLVMAATPASVALAQGVAGPDPLGLRSAALILTDLSASSPLVRAVILGGFLSMAGLLGDLVESSFKRDACVKDSGKVMPRFGGILDLVDSPLFAVPVGWFLLTAVWNMV